MSCSGAGHPSVAQHSSVFVSQLRKLLDGAMTADLFQLTRSMDVHTHQSFIRNPGKEASDRVLGSAGERY